MLAITGLVGVVTAFIVLSLSFTAAAEGDADTVIPVAFARDDDCDASDADCELSLRQLRAKSIMAHSISAGCVDCNDSFGLLDAWSSQVTALNSIKSSFQPAIISKEMRGLDTTSLSSSLGSMVAGCKILARKVSSQCGTDSDNMDPEVVNKMCSCQEAVQALQDQCPQYKEKLTWYNDYQEMCSPCGKAFTILAYTSECTDLFSETGLKEASVCDASCHSLICETVSNCQAPGSKAPNNNAENTALAVALMEHKLKDKGCVDCSTTQVPLVEQQSLVQESQAFSSYAAVLSKQSVFTAGVKQLRLVADVPGNSDTCSAMAFKLEMDCVPADSNDLVPSDVTKMCACRPVIQNLKDTCPQYQDTLDTFYDEYQTLCSPCGEPFGILVTTKECLDDSPDGFLKESAICSDRCHTIICDTIANCLDDGAAAPGISENETKSIISAMELELVDENCSDCQASFVQEKTKSAHRRRSTSTIAMLSQQRVVSNGIRGLGLSMAGLSETCVSLASDLKRNCTPADPDAIVPNDISRMCACRGTLQNLKVNCPQFQDALNTFYDDFQTVCSTCGEPFSVLISTKQCLDGSPDGFLDDSKICSDTCHPLACHAITNCLDSGSKAPGLSSDDTADLISAMKSDLEDENCSDCRISKF